MTKTATKAKTTPRRPRKPPPVVRCDDVGYVYEDGTVALKGVNLLARPGEIVGVTGESGSGKSTLLRLLDGALAPTSGTVDVGEVGWLVPAVGITVEDAYRLGATWVEFSPLHERTPAVVLADEPVDHVADMAVVEELHDTLVEARDRGAAVVVSTHCEDTLDEVCDRVRRLGRRPPATRSESLATCRAAFGPLDRPPSLAELEAAVSNDGALVVTDTNHGCYVLLPRLQWNTRQFGRVSRWVVVDSATMRRMLRRRHRHDERTLGPRTNGRHRLLDVAGEDLGDPDERRYWYGGDAARAPGAHAWWPGLGPLRPWLAVREDEEAFATHTSYRPPHPLALTPEQCEEIIALGKDGLPASLTGYDFRADEDMIDDRMSRALRQQIVLALRSANAVWWGFDLDDFQGFELKFYGPGHRHQLHVDLAPTVSTRKLSVSVQLSAPDAYTGGDLVLHAPGLAHDDVVTAPREQGSLILYPTWTPHEVKEVTAGERWSLVVQAHGPRFR